MKLKPRDLSHPKIFQSPAAAAAAASVAAAYALAKSEKLDFPQIIDLNFNGVENNVPKKDINLEINAIKEEKVVLESSIDEVRAENSRLGEKIDELKSNHTELSKVCSRNDSTRSFLYWSGSSYFLKYQCPALVFSAYVEIGRGYD